MFHIPDSKLIKHRSFIPSNTALPNTCAMRDQYVVQNLDKKHFELNMDFTYGQMDRLNTALACFREIVLQNNVKIKIDGAHTTKYTIVKFEVQREYSAKNNFYKLLAYRTKSGKCIEYTCIHWNAGGSKPTKISTPSMTIYIRNNYKCTVNPTIAMEYPESIDMIKVQLATNNTNSFMHLTTCLQNILGDQ